MSETKAEYIAGTPEVQTLVLPFELPGLNETIAASKAHWSAYAREKKLYTDIVAFFARKLKPIRGRVRIDFVWYCRDKRRDPDNIAAGGRKIVLDGLVAAGRLEGDGWRQIAGFSDSFTVDKENPRIELTINVDSSG